MNQTKGLLRKISSKPNVDTMRKIKFGTGIVVFILFFGVAVLEVIQSKNWIGMLFWLSMGIAFLVADNLRRAQ